jgi:hypothetical protein
MNGINEFVFTGTSEEFNAEAGIYILEVWGAQGGGIYGGKGGYSIGTFKTGYESKLMYVYVGGKNGFNGGGAGGGYSPSDGNSYTAGNGGGATDIRINGTELIDRIIVAGGGGGSSARSTADTVFTGGAGGGLSGGIGYSYYGGLNVGTQTSGYALGQGMDGAKYRATGSSPLFSSAGGGGGYWGGYAQYTRNSLIFDGGTGGSGYVSSILTEAETIVGQREGDGAAKITRQCYIPYKPKLINNNLSLTKIITPGISNISILINNIEVDVIQNPTEDVVEYIISNDDCNYGINAVRVIVTVDSEDVVDDTYEYNLIYVKYGNKIPEGSDIETVVRYLDAMNSGIKDLSSNLKNILNKQGIDTGSIVKLTDLINLCNQLLIEGDSDINELNTRIIELEAELAGKVNPVGTAVAANVLTGKTFINSTGNTLTGTMANNGTKTITPSTSTQTLGAGYYDKITINGDADLVPENIVSGKSICGVNGTAIKAPNVTAGSSYYLLRGVYVSGQHSVDYYGGYIKNGKIYSNQNYILFRMYFPFSGTISIDYIYYFTDWYNQIKVYNKAGTLVNQTANEKVGNANTRLSHNLQVEAGGRIDICGYGVDYGTNGADTSTPDSNYLRDLNVKFSLS